MVGTGNRLHALVTSGAIGLRYQARDDYDLRLDLKTLLLQATAHFLLQGAHLVQNVDHLPAGVRATQHVRLAEPAVRRKNRHGKYHRNARQESLQIVRGRRLQDIEQQLHGFAHPPHVPAPAMFKTQATQLGADAIPVRIGILATEVLISGTQR
jgi:hypothetical protein